MTERKPQGANLWTIINELAQLPARMRDSYANLVNRQDEAIERLASIERLLKKQEKRMAKGQEKLTAEIEELRQAVDAWSSAAGARVEEAVAAAREAWEAENDAAFEEAAKQLDEIASKLNATDPIEPGPGEEPVEPFEPSGNTAAGSKGKKPKGEGAA
jgi:DNA repair exonuclease SbcCD ATPase subunit